MANKEHVLILKQGVDVWNQWRRDNPDSTPDFLQANLADMNLAGAYLSDGDFVGANLQGSDLSQAELMWSSLSGANLKGTIFYKADLTQSNLIATKLNGANLSKANLRIADLQRADLENVNLAEANLTGANLNKANLTGANLNEANLNKCQVLGTNFTRVMLTGACVEDWNINTQTDFNQVDCLYIYRKINERYPSSGNFASGEFIKLFQKSLSFIDLIFRDGIDWRAFAFTFEKIKLQNPQAELAIQSIEIKGDGILLIRVNTSPEIDKTQIHSDFTKSYEFVSKILQERYQAEIAGKDAQIVQYNEEIQRQREYINGLFYLVSQSSQKLGEVPKIMAEQIPKIQQTFTGQVYGVAGNVEGDQNINVSSSTPTLEVFELINSLRGMAGNFPEIQREEALVHLDDLEKDVNLQGERQPQRIKARLMALLSVATVLGGTIATATDFTNNIFEISEKLGVPIPTQVNHAQPLQKLPKPED